MHIHGFNYTDDYKPNNILDSAKKIKNKKITRGDI